MGAYRSYTLSRYSCLTSDVEEAEQLNILEGKINDLEKNLKEMERAALKNAKKFKKIVDHFSKTDDSSPVKGMSRNSSLAFAAKTK